MRPQTKTHFENLFIKDKEKRYASFQELINETNQPVDWAGEVWQKLLELAKAGDNHQRTMAVQLLSNLAKSDTGKRMEKDMPKLFEVTKDEKFVTARHSLMSLWKIGIVSDTLKKKVLNGLAKRFEECKAEKNCTLIRYDIIEVIRKMYDQQPDEKYKKTSLELIETETDDKYRKKYQGAWKDLLK